MKNRFLLLALTFSFVPVLLNPAAAQTLRTLHNFTATSPTSYTNSDGARPSGGVILSGDTLYGTAQYGGVFTYGTVFSLKTDGTAFTTLHHFNFYDGCNPLGGLLLSSNILYGTTSQGGTLANSGQVFALSTDGTGFTNLHTFVPLAPNFPYVNSEGATPYGGLILLSNTLYGTASAGGDGAGGTVFALSRDGTAFTNLHSFTARLAPFHTNADGARPLGALSSSGRTLYGTAFQGGGSANGTVFRVNIDGTGFTTLHSFTDASSFSDIYINEDGVGPAFVLASMTTLYGTAAYGGTSGNGTVFKLKNNGAAFTNLHSFSELSDLYIGTNTDGATPFGAIILSGNTLYGTTKYGGSCGSGTVFALNTDGTGFTTLYSFTALSAGTNFDGANPVAGLFLSRNTLYGTTSAGGTSGNGTVFSLPFPPKLAIIPSGPYVILTWPTNYAGFSYTAYELQSATNLDSPIWTTVSPRPVTIGGQNVVVNTISDTPQFYRLIW